METKIILVSPDYKVKKILFQKSLKTAYEFNSKTGETVSRIFPDICSFKIYKEYIYIGLSSLENFYFVVFDANGKRLYEMNRPYQKKEIPGAIVISDFIFKSYLQWREVLY